MPWPVSFAYRTNAAILAPNTSLVFLLTLKLSLYSSAVLPGMVKRPAILHMNMTHETAQVFRFRDFQDTEAHFRDFDGTEERAFVLGNVQKWTTFTYNNRVLRLPANSVVECKASENVCENIYLHCAHGFFFFACDFIFIIIIKRPTTEQQK